jgi:glucose-6-phosphate isomerase
VTDVRDAAEAEIARLGAQGVPRRIWGEDHTVWSADPGQITRPNRLGWLRVADEMSASTGELRSFGDACAGQGLTTAVLCGMGGSSLAPQVFRRTLGVAGGALDLVTLDTTHPDHVRAVTDALDPERTLFVISSKSGTTLETRCHLEYFWDRVPRGERFVAVTDPGSPLATLGQERGFRRVFENPPSIGGRYSALSLFGLVPAALLGADLDGLLDSAHRMAAACGADVAAAENPAVRLGALLGAAAALGRDKLVLHPPGPIASLGIWIEQLIAESTGKLGKGILPVAGAPPGPPAAEGPDRLFVALGDAGADPALAELEAAGHPVERLGSGSPSELGGQMFLWEFATAVVGNGLGINPFDQPDVQAAKDATGRLLSSGQVPAIETDDLAAMLEGAAPPDYVAIQAYLAPTQENAERLEAARRRIRETSRCAATVGFGPRYLHSTGQLHKGGPPTGLFVQVVQPPDEDLAIPGEPFSFGTLIAAQSAGDAQALQERDRPLARVTLDQLERATR